MCQEIYVDMPGRLENDQDFIPLLKLLLAMVAAQVIQLDFWCSDGTVGE